MSSVEEKINIFRQELQQQVDLDRLEKINKVKEQSELEIRNAEISLKRQEKQIEDRFKKLQERNTNKILSDARNQAQDIILKTRRDIHDGFRKNIVVAIKEFLEDSRYQDYIERCLDDLKTQVPEPQELVLYANESDIDKIRPLAKKALEEYEITYRELPETEIGGLIARDHDERISYDYSVRSLLNENDYNISSILRKAMIKEKN